LQETPARFGSSAPILEAPHLQRRRLCRERVYRGRVHSREGVWQFLRDIGSARGWRWRLENAGSFSPRRRIPRPTTSEWI